MRYRGFVGPNSFGPQTRAESPRANEFAPTSATDVQFVVLPCAYKEGE